MSSVPKFKKDIIYQKLREFILTGVYAPGMRLPKELDFARELGVSFITLRNALSRLDEEHLIVRIPSKGTFVNDVTATENLSRTAVQRKILLGMPDFNGNPATENLFNRGLILGAVKQGYLSGYEIINCHFADIDAQLSENPVVGVIWDRPGQQEIERIEKLRNQGLPQVSVNRLVEQLPLVGCNYPSAIRQTVRHLRGIGHKYIALIDHAPENASVFAERQDAFIEQLRFGGVESPERFLIAGNRGNDEVLFHIAEGMRQIPEVSAVIVSSVFIEAFHLYLQEEQIGVPGELSVVQWGENIKFGQHTDHPYSILTEPRSAIGQRAVNLISAMRQGCKAENSIQLLDSELLMRKGCALPREFKKIIGL